MSNRLLTPKITIETPKLTAANIREWVNLKAFWAQQTVTAIIA